MEYLKTKDNLNLIGKRARIKNNVLGYCSFLYNCEGIIKNVNDKIYLEFNKIAYRDETDKINKSPFGMNGVYICYGVIEVLN